MKKNAVIYVLVFIIVVTIIISISSYRTLETSKIDLEEKILSSQNEIVDLKSLIANNKSEVGETLIGLNSQIEDYEFIINRWFDFDFYNDVRFELIRKSYDVEAIVRTKDRSFPLPKNGKIVVDSDYVELEINVVKPPNINDDKINEIIHIYDRILGDLKYDSYDSEAEYFEEDGVIHLKFSNLEYEDKIDIFVQDELYELLGLVDSNIKIMITNDFSNAKEYVPLNIKRKTFDGAYSDIIHYFTYVSENAWILDFSQGFGDAISKIENDDAVKVKYEFNEMIKVTEISWNGVDFVPFERVILPQKIKLGESWTDQSRVATITAVDYPIETVNGSLNTVEVTYTADNKEQYILYYAKGFGVVHRRMYWNRTNELIEIEY